MTVLLLAAAVLFLAWSNGANDNFKGVATLYGSRTASYRAALVWATGTTLAGSLVSVLLARGLARSFSGKGLIPADLLDPALLAAVGAAGALTVLLATLMGMPTSTTHALTGALVGAGAAAAGLSGVDWGILAGRFARPLLISPLLAIAGAATLYPLLRRLRLATGIERETCLCVGEGIEVPVAAGGGAAFNGAPPPLRLQMGSREDCVERYRGRVLGVRAQQVVDALHYLSGGAVCFARAVNDTPKIAALLLGAQALVPSSVSPASLGATALAMAAGGWLHSRKVAETMSRRITDLNPGQGLTANLVTVALVLGASRMGLPVSTTHVSCGSLFGIGLVSGRAHRGTIAQIILTWVTTLPLGLLLGALLFRLLHAIGI